MHGIGEGALMLNPYTATSYFGAKALDNIRQGNLGAGTALDATVALAPWAAPLTSKFRYPWEAIPKVSLGRNVAGDWNGWINVGNYQYRPNRSTLGINKLVESKPMLNRRAAITSEDLANRIFFPVEEYGSEPIYTRETVPQNIELKRNWDIDPIVDTPDLDITYMDYNFDHNNPMTPKEVIRNMSERFNKSAHGRAVGFDEHEALSTDSYPLALAQFQRLHNKGLGTFFIPQ